MCAVAAKGGHFKLLQWLHEMQCPWDYRISKYIAKSGNLEHIKWLYKCGAPFYDDILYSAT